MSSRTLRPLLLSVSHRWPSSVLVQLAVTPPNPGKQELQELQETRNYRKSGSGGSVVWLCSHSTLTDWQHLYDTPHQQSIAMHRQTSCMNAPISKNYRCLRRMRWRHQMNDCGWSQSEMCMCWCRIVRCLVACVVGVGSIDV